MKHCTAAILIAVLALLSTVTANAQSPNMLEDLAARINRERTTRGMVPLALNANLTAAAQAHASDIARTGKLSHTGSDGSTVFQRVARTGFGAYSWGRRLGENWAWYHSTEIAMQKWMASQPHRANILHALYREFGIGIAPNPAGGYVFVIVFGAQPNVLPVFINDGASTTSGSGVTIVLSDEQVAPSGDIPATMGHPTQVQLSNDPGFAGANWEPYSARKSWTLASGSGVQTVYVRFRDSHGRMATSSDSIVAGSAAASLSTFGTSPTPKPPASPTQTRRPTATRTRTPRPTAKPSPTVTRTKTPTATLTPVLPDTLVAMASATETVSSETRIASSFEEQPTQTATVALSAAEDAGDTVVTQVAYVGTPSDESAGYLVAISMLDGVNGVALGVFAVGAVLGIMAMLRSGLRPRSPREQYSMEQAIETAPDDDD